LEGWKNGTIAFYGNNSGAVKDIQIKNERKGGRNKIYILTIRKNA
jgi:hypothetical protein